MNHELSRSCVARRAALFLGLAAAGALLAGCAVDMDEEPFEDEEEEIGTAEQELACPEDDPDCNGYPGAPSGLNVTRLTSAVRLGWYDNSDNEIGYRVQRRRYGTSTWYTPTNPTYPNGPDGAPLWPSEANPMGDNVEAWVDRTATPGVTYQYRVRVHDRYGYRDSNTITVTVPQRPLVTSLASSHRTTLGSMMQSFLTDATVNRHSYFRHMNSGSGFLYDHRRYIQQFEDYLVDNGLSNLVPLAMWSSATTIPTELRPVRAYDSGTARTPISNPSPGITRPSNLVPSQSCSYTSLESLGMAAQSPWHNSVHGAVGGSMGSVSTASAAYIFLPWHAYVDDVWTRWQKDCRTD